MDQEMYSHLEWQLNFDPSMLHNFQAALPICCLAWLACMFVTITDTRFQCIKTQVDNTPFSCPSSLLGQVALWEINQME